VDAPSPDDRDAFRSIVQAATSRPDIASAAIFILNESGVLTLAAASGIEGEPLEILESAVRNPGHPIAWTLTERQSNFNVTPMAPGGPALRSHLPLLVERGGWLRAVGVMAVAHDRSLDESEQEMLTELAAQAASTAAGGSG
jgi:hypothetical protein